MYLSYFPGNDRKIFYGQCIYPIIKKPPPKGRLQILGRTVGEEREEVLAQ
jgi:hypothetical protein